jgi:predicted MFS family arabinose efflux permease
MDVAMNANAVEVERGLKRAIMSSSHGFWSLGGFLGSAFGGFLLAPFGAMVQELLVSLFVLLFFCSFGLYLCQITHLPRAACCRASYSHHHRGPCQRTS